MVYPKQHLVYTPENWYWMRENGVVFSSAIGDFIHPATDDAFLAWQAHGHRPTVWPRDDNGEQTDLALHEVLAAHGLGIGIHAAREAAFAEVMAYHEARSFKARAAAMIDAADNSAELAAVVASLKVDIDKPQGRAKSRV